MLWGAALAVREQNGLALAPENTADYERATNHAREQLGPERFAELVAQGLRLTPQEALAYALQD